MNSQSSSFIDDSLNSNSITIYEDDNDSFNKSIVNKNISGLIKESKSNRSPLATVSYNAGSNSHQIVSYSSKNLPDPKTVPKAVEDTQNPFDLMSDEIVLNVFKYLPKKALFRLAVVCRRFSQITQDESLWIRMDLGNKSIRSTAMSRILCRGFVILRLAQTKIASPIFEPCFPAAEFRSKLQYLDLSLSNIDKKSLQLLMGTCRKLKKLSLENMELDGNVCTEIAANKDLEVLNLAMCSGIDQESISNISASLQE